MTCIVQTGLFYTSHEETQSPRSPSRNCGQSVLLAWEMVVEAGLGSLRSVDDLVDSDCHIAALGEQIGRSF